MTDIRKETDSLGVVSVPADKLWGAQTQRSLEHFSIGKDVIPREMISTYETRSKSAHYAMDNDLTLKDAALKLGFVTEGEFDRVVDPTKVVHAHVATGK